jgi:hypothetical protein
MFMLSLGIFFRHFELANAAITGTGSSSSLQTCLSRSLAAEEHTAIEMLLCLLGDNERDLVRVAEPLDQLDTDLWILTHPALKGAARIKAFTDFLYDRLRAE